MQKALLALLCSWGLCISLHAEHRLDIGENAYYWHYRNLDSTAYYANKLIKAGHHAIGLNDLAFVDIARMEYNKAEAKLQRVYDISENQVELLIADVQMMRICQRRSMNKEYYDYQNSAENRMARIHEEDGRLSYLLTKRLAYAESEFYIVSSTYYYYVGLEQKSKNALDKINPEELIQLDSVQTANYYYNAGADGDDYALERSLYLANQQQLIFFGANCLQAFAENTTNVEMAKQSLELFIDYGDIYQIAGAYRTLANCYISKGEYKKALDNLKHALNVSPRIDYAPDLLASIHERLSVVFAALGNINESIYNRKEYLSLQQGKRQDRFLENRLETLRKEFHEQAIWISGVISSILLLILMLIVFYRMRKRVQRKSEAGQAAEIEQLHSLYEEEQEQKLVAEQKLISYKRCHAENRAKVSLINSLLPLIERMAYMVNKTDTLSKEDVAYIKELLAEISSKNSMLTEWIKLRRGELNLKVETFALQPLFNLLKKAESSCRLKGISFKVEDTKESVKADRILTLFMLNTLIDNALKFTPAGGEIKVSTHSEDGYVEISVADTGQGMEMEQINRLFTASGALSATAADNKLAREGHGFGLMNCRGIIEKYKKASRLFKDAMISAESKQEKGSRFFFRLPKGIMRILILALGINISLVAVGQTLNDSAIIALTNKDFATYEHYNNKYIHSLKESSIDKRLPSYCATLQESKTNRMVSIVLLVLILLSIVPLYYLIVWRFAKSNRIRQREHNENVYAVTSAIEMLQDETRKTSTQTSALYVANNVLDNCLSTIKHETMSYPARISAQLSDVTDDGLPASTVEELITYYKDLYTLLDRQAMRQTERLSLHLHKYEFGDENILGDKILLDYLFEMTQKNIISHTTEGDYVRFTLEGEITDTKYLICRQIIRDHAEATQRRGCGIERTEKEIMIKLPRYGKF